MAKELPKTYDPREVEDKIYGLWLGSGGFRADASSGGEPFTIVIPPPNVTGQLHIGHALDNTLQDIIIRYRRMQGYCALWLPGTDHAGIATQIKVEEILRREEGLTRHDLGREKFLERVWEWKNLYGGRIINQLKKLGASCDWERERFTMDEGCSEAVREAFVSLYNKGLIYRGYRIINWCPDCATALSDAEVEYEEHPGHFWHIRYPVKDSDEYVVIATTRPETMLGDTAVAVNPEDSRYASLVGKTLILPLMEREIPVIADDYVDMEFGTGCVKITPCHDPNDFEVGRRHNLPQVLVMDGAARINENGGVYQGLGRYEARERIVRDLEAGGYLVKTEDHTHNVGQCYRCGSVVEPITSKQWFVSMKPLAEPAMDVVRNGEIEFIPQRFSKIYLNWMENVHDWCISRQLWWGHRIPAYHCPGCGEIAVAKDPVEKCPRCGAATVPDSDVLDTWFSSALWPFSTLGWPDLSAPDLNYFYPTSVLVTAYDIIFFWVARMIFSGVEHMGRIPFNKVFIHGLVRDAQGRKMSKSLNNGVDPLEVIEEYGADALRFALTSGTSPGNDTRFTVEKVEAGRNFMNKLWNASRFVMMNLKITECRLPENPEPEDRWIIDAFNALAAEVTENLDKYEPGVALQKLYDFVWDCFCDWYVELVKPRLYESGGENAESAQYTLCWTLERVLRLLHPFIPFITEEIWQALPRSGDTDTLMTALWPEFSPDNCYPEESRSLRMIMDAIRAVRAVRAELQVPPSRKAALYIETDDAETFRQGMGFYGRLAHVTETRFGAPEGVKAVRTVVPGAILHIPLAELIDLDRERARLSAERERLESEIARSKSKLSNEKFTAKAPERIVAEEREKLAEFESTLRKVEASLEDM